MGFGAISGRNRRTVAPSTLLMSVALTMLAAPVYVVLGRAGRALFDRREVR